MKQTRRWLASGCLVLGVLAVALCPALSGGGDEREEATEKEVALDDVPAEVKAIILEQAAGGEITEVEETVRGDLRIFEAEWLQGDKEVEVQVMFVCRLVGKSIELAQDDGEDEEEDEDGEEDEEIEEVSEQEVSFNQVPAPVRDALAKEAGTSRILEIEQITTNKGKFFEAEWLDGKWVVEVVLAADGKLLCKESALCRGFCICHDGDDDDEDGEDDDGDDDDDDDGDDEDDDDDDDEDEDEG